MNGWVCNMPVIVMLGEHMYTCTRTHIMHASFQFHSGQSVGVCSKECSLYKPTLFDKKREHIHADIPN